MKKTRITTLTIGNIIIAEPFMHDPAFKRSVILICEHGEKGTVGIILNKPTEISVNDGIADFPPIDSRLYFGGPVGVEVLQFIHKVKDVPKSKEVLPGIYFGGDIERLKFLIDTRQVRPNDIRFYAGYSGWNIHDLASEISERLWIKHQGDIDESSLIFSEKPEKTWQNTLRTMGKEYAVIANFPENPSFN